MVFIDGMDPHGLWVKSKQPKSNERKNLLGINTGREEKRRDTRVFPEKVAKIQAE